MLVKLDKCLCCESKSFVGLNVKPISEGHEAAIGLDSDPQWCVCTDCGFVFHNPRPERQKAEDFYAASEFRDPDPADLEGYVNFSPHQLTRFDEWLRVCGFDLRTVQNGNCLDFGCGVGGSLSFLAGQGNRNYGVEIDLKMMELGQRLFPIEIVRDVSLLEPNLELDLIFTNHAIEHIYDPNEFFAYARSHLKESGWMIIAVPAWRYSNVAGTFNGFGASDYAMWDHVALSRFLNKHGLYMCSYLYQNYGKGGDWELVSVAVKSEQKNHFTFDLKICLDELYTNINARAAVSREEEMPEEKMCAIMEHPAL